MRISDWSSYVCSSDLLDNHRVCPWRLHLHRLDRRRLAVAHSGAAGPGHLRVRGKGMALWVNGKGDGGPGGAESGGDGGERKLQAAIERSEERRVGKGGVRTCRYGWWQDQ